MIGHGCPRASRRCRLPATRWGRLPTWPSLAAAATWLCCAFGCHAHACRGHEASNHITCPRYAWAWHPTCVLIALLLALASQTAMADDLRVRIAWGGGADRVWQGTISVSEGSLSDPQALGVEADEPGSMWLDGNSDGAAKLVVRQRSPRTYDGVDALVSAPPSARLLVQLSAVDDSAPPNAIEIPLSDLSGEFVSKELDKRGNRLVTTRCAGRLTAGAHCSRQPRLCAR